MTAFAGTSTGMSAEAWLLQVGIMINSLISCLHCHTNISQVTVRDPIPQSSHVSAQTVVSTDSSVTEGVSNCDH